MSRISFVLEVYSTREYPEMCNNNNHDYYYYYYYYLDILIELCFITSFKCLLLFPHVQICLSIDMKGQDKGKTSARQVQERWMRHNWLVFQIVLFFQSCLFREKIGANYYLFRESIGRTGPDVWIYKENRFKYFVLLIHKWKLANPKEN